MATCWLGGAKPSTRPRPRPGPAPLALERSGRGLTPARARIAASNYLEAAGHPGQVRVEDDRVEVRVSFNVPSRVLGIVGIRNFDVDGEGRARNVQGRVEEEP